MEKGAVIKHDIKKAPKTGNWRNIHPIVDKEKCIGCGNCVKFCPEAVIDLKRKTWNVERQKEKSSAIRDTRYANIDYYFCKGCGVCANVCPVKAIIMKKE